VDVASQQLGDDNNLLELGESDFDDESDKNVVEDAEDHVSSDPSLSSVSHVDMTAVTSSSSSSSSSSSNERSQSRGRHAWAVPQSVPSSHSATVKRAVASSSHTQFVPSSSSSSSSSSTKIVHAVTGNNPVDRVNVRSRHVTESHEQSHEQQQQQQHKRHHVWAAGATQSEEDRVTGHKSMVTEDGVEFIQK